MGYMVPGFTRRQQVGFVALLVFLVVVVIFFDSRFALVFSDDSFSHPYVTPMATALY
jgi:hypothetical protein